MFSNSLMTWIKIVLIISMVMFCISCFFLKEEPLRETKSKFESGMDQNEQENPPFYMHFFYIGILFLVFDVELVLSLPMIQSSMSMTGWTLFWSVFIMLVYLGLLLEVNADSIEWKE